MKRIIHIVTILWIVLPALSSCRAISGFLHDDEIVAEVGAVKLYRSDIDRVVPKGLSPEDSTRMALQYINAWASDLVFLNIAEEQLSKVEKDVTRELDDYRKSLLKYRYEQLYVNERLDTAVNDSKVEEYFEAHREHFTLDRPVLKARFLRIASDSPVLPQLRKMMASMEADDLVAADSIAYTAAMKFTTWDDRWIDVVVLSREFGMDYVTALASMKNGWMEHADTLGNVSIAFVPEIRRQGETAPLEYCTPAIKDMIISARKQALVTGLEQDLLRDARENGQFVIF